MYNKKKSTKMKKNKIIFLMIMLVIFIFITTVFGRYITSSIHDFFLRSKEFYFYSDKLNLFFLIKKFQKFIHIAKICIIF